MKLQKFKSDEKKKKRKQENDRNSLRYSCLLFLVEGNSDWSKTHFKDV